MCVSLISSSWNWQFMIFRHIFRHFRTSTCFWILIFSQLMMSTCVYIQTFRINTGSFRKYPSFSRFFILFINNGIRCYFFINYYNFIRRCITGPFRKYLRFNSFLILLIRNGRNCYVFIHCSKICRSCTTASFRKYLRSNIFFILFISNGNRFYGFTFVLTFVEDVLRFLLDSLI